MAAWPRVRVPAYAMAPFTAHPATGTTSSSSRATARRPRPAPTVATISGNRLLRLELQAERQVEQQEHAHLVEREHGQVGARHEQRRRGEPVLPRERRDDPVADRAA